MAGGGAQAPQDNAPEGKAKAAQAQADATNAALFQQLMGNQKAIYDARGAASPFYYRQQRAPAQQSPFVQVPGFQGMYNPFYTPTTPAQQYAGADRAAALTNQYNAYKSNLANQMYNAKVSQMAQQNAQQKARQDAQAAAKAKAEAEAAAARQREQAEIPSWGTAFSDIGSGGGAANGGIADLYQGFK